VKGKKMVKKRCVTVLDAFFVFFNGLKICAFRVNDYSWIAPSSENESSTTEQTKSWREETEGYEFDRERMHVRCTCIGLVNH